MLAYEISELTDFAHGINRHASAEDRAKVQKSAKRSKRDISKGGGERWDLLMSDFGAMEYLGVFIRWVEQGHIHTRRRSFFSSFSLSASLRFFGLESHGDRVGPRIPARKGTWGGE